MEDGTPAVTRSYQILVVEDNLLMRSILEGHLRELGHTVTSVENGRKALEQLEKDFYSIVITDLVMPELDGLSLCRSIRKRDTAGYTYIMMLTSQNSKEDMIRGLEAGADEYLIKPVSHTELSMRLKTADRILTLESSLKKSYDEIKALSVRDPLTKVFNRGYLDERLLHEVKRSFRFQRSLAVVMFDIDHFKLINDTFGHAAGDQVLMECAGLMGSSIRQEIDWIARYGGEEFTVVLPETPVAGARIAAERMRFRLASHVFIVGGMELRITASFGVVGFTPSDHTESPDFARTLIFKADECLYRAKKEGRDRVVTMQL
jgi:diguanylate cyclase (GGDEF)-like protein